MPYTAYGNFHNFCRDSTLPICNLFATSTINGGPGYGGCDLEGITLSSGNFLRNLGVILLDGLAILITVILIWLSQRKRAAVGRREMQLFLLGYIIIDICEIFSIGGIPYNHDVTKTFSAVHIGMITATTWMLMINGAVGYQVLDDGNLLSILLILGSAAAIFIGTGYIALDTAFDWTGYFNTALIQNPPYNREYSLYTLYLLVPIIFLVIYFVLEAVLVIKILGEVRPLFYLALAALLFVIGQIFQFVISPHICTGTTHDIDGSFFATFFTMLAVIMVWIFWSSITEDDWPQVEAHDDTE